ncbi:MAG: Na+/H+ antiporter NhaA [Gemmatimonadaceae bacterium]|nr:Na+/H+ antiporter NhaA [Gemmatimonadaceae bacterium]
MHADTPVTSPVLERLAEAASDGQPIDLPTIVPPDERPEPLVERVLAPFQQFMHAEASGGLVLLFNAILALVWANSPWSASYHHLWETKVTIGAPGFGLTESLHHWINDGLMAVFFFVVGLEIKREVLVGELASVRQAALPLFAAVGGMVVPALVFSALTLGTEASRGWGVPMATDIAFALGIAALLGSRVPTSLKVFLAALAIVDDIGAVLVIALFYTSSIQAMALLVAAVVMIALIGLNRAGVRSSIPYFLLGAILWVAFLKSGVHATIAGVLLAFTIPASTRISGQQFLHESLSHITAFDAACENDPAEFRTVQRHQEPIFALEDTAQRAQSPLLRLEHKLHGVVAFGIMPIFALANAGVSLPSDLGAAIGNAAVLGIFFGLLIGKPLGITLFSWIAVRLRLADLPTGATWHQVIGVGALGGIGFTMALFIAALAFGEGAALESAKLGILAGSLVAGVVGWLLLRRGTSDAP